MSEQENVLKDSFAAALLRMPDDPFRAAAQIFGLDTIRCLHAAQIWVNDPYVLTKQAELLETLGEDSFMPSKLTLARRVYELAENPSTDKRERIKAYELYANIMGMIAKQSLIGHQTNVMQNNRVMVIKDFGTDEQWEKATREQQTKLIEHARD